MQYVSDMSSPAINIGADTRRFGSPSAGGVLAVLLLASVPPATRAADLVPPPPDCDPSMGDLMTISVQPRHIKLGLAVRAHNWDYGTYEVSELKNAFGRVIKLNPVYRKTDMAGMYESNMKDPMDQMEAAIKDKNAKALDAAYAMATKGCNTRHLALSIAW